MVTKVVRVYYQCTEGHKGVVELTITQYQQYRRTKDAASICPECACMDVNKSSSEMFSELLNNENNW